jgi:20S proteasome subunit beta 4
MDVVMGIAGKGFVLVCADRVAARSINVYKQDCDKILTLDSSKVMAAAGPQGDRSQFGEFIQKSIKLYALKSNYELSVKAAVNFTRDKLATALRKGPYQVNLLIGTYSFHHPASTVVTVTVPVPVVVVVVVVILVSLYLSLSFCLSFLSFFCRRIR